VFLGNTSTAGIISAKDKSGTPNSQIFVEYSFLCLVNGLENIVLLYRSNFFYFF
jgi:hypothetical protein